MKRPIHVSCGSCSPAAGPFWQLLGAALCVMLFSVPHSLARELMYFPKFPDGSRPSMNVLSRDGLVAAGSSHAAPGSPVRWSANTGLTEVPTAGSPFEALGAVQGANQDGSILIGWGYRTDAFEIEGFLFSDGTMNSLGTLAEPEPGTAHTLEAFVVSEDGSIVSGWCDSPTGQQAFRWTSADGMVALGDLDGGSLGSRIYGGTPDASTLVGWGNNQSGQVAVKWTEGEGFVSLGDLPGGDVRSGANAITDDGAIVVGFGTAENGTEAFRWSAAEGMVSLGDLPGGAVGSSALASSSDGSVVVGVSLAESGTEPFIWDAVRGLRNLTDVLIHDYGYSQPPQTLGAARDISADGKVILGSTWLADLSFELRPGDANFDGLVDLSDFGTLKVNFGNGAFRDQGDFNADGKVTLDDFGLLKEHFGTAAAPVPEPTTLSYLTVGACLSIVTLLRRATVVRRFISLPFF